MFNEANVILRRAGIWLEIAPALDNNTEGVFLIPDQSNKRDGTPGTITYYEYTVIDLIDNPFEFINRLSDYGRNGLTIYYLFNVSVTRANKWVKLAGAAEVGSNECLISRIGSSRTLAHEIGHCLGLNDLQNSKEKDERWLMNQGPVGCNGKKPIDVAEDLTSGQCDTIWQSAAARFPDDD